MRIEQTTPADLERLIELAQLDREASAARLRWHLTTPYAFALKTVLGSALMSGLSQAIAHEDSGWIGERFMMPRFRSDALEDRLI